MSINVSITTEHFISIFGQSEFCRTFTRDGMRSVLGYIEDIQEERDSSETNVIDWTNVFMNCSEYTDSDLVAEFIEFVDEETQENAEDIDDMVSAILESFGRDYRIADNGNIILFD